VSAGPGRFRSVSGQIPASAVAKDPHGVEHRPIFRENRAMRSVGLFLAPLLLFVGACGASAPPTYQLTQSEAAIRAALEVGAEDTPQAALHLKMARDQVRSAKALMVEHENDRARHLLRRAEADANLAIALAKEDAAKQETLAAERKLETLRRDGE
jgi:hypothetical protein